MKKVLLLLLLAAVLFVALGWDMRLKTVTYTLNTGKLERSVRLALVTDLHCCDYGENHHQLLDAIEAAQPDAVLLGGDILDDTMPLERGLAALEAMAARWPCYYVTGNHDAYLADQVAACGVPVLTGEYADLILQGQSLRLYGIADPRAEGETVFSDRLAAFAGVNADYSGLSVLLTHRPARIGQYLPGGYDLVLAGHAHGGQWRIPGLLNGLIAPGEGLFPKYAGGRYDLEGTTLIVSRGLARESTRVPRLYNPPELVLVDIT